MQRFQRIYQRAAERKGGEEALRALLPDNIKSPQQLAMLGDDRYLAEMTKAIFKAGFAWKVIDKKWPGFEEAFWGFDIGRCAFMSPDDEDALCADTRIVRNRQKILTVPQNAVMISEVRKKYGSFARLVAEWPSEDYIGLLAYLGKHGARLGGMTAQYFLRFVGKDGFVLSRDGVYALIEAGIIDKPPTSQAAIRKVQQAYNHWGQETGWGLAEISRILGLSIDAPKK
ncbi:DNA-3-methyladenine glycosylase I [Pelobacter seleniigenes]|uniref:DNA-3-methyladenine glycosylase I n=1 Tax=Pelobacter seleniigenes TaxID=407188 RepID=UPI0004A752CD|nr:DNA-3-methyladenine glycosylase I [Pelobacter seleniigenes]